VFSRVNRRTSSGLILALPLSECDAILTGRVSQRSFPSTTHTIALSYSCDELHRWSDWS